MPLHHVCWSGRREGAELTAGVLPPQPALAMAMLLTPEQAEAALSQGPGHHQPLCPSGD